MSSSAGTSSTCHGNTVVCSHFRSQRCWRVVRSELARRTRVPIDLVSVRWLRRDSPMGPPRRCDDEGRPGAVTAASPHRHPSHGPKESTTKRGGGTHSGHVALGAGVTIDRRDGAASSGIGEGPRELPDRPGPDSHGGLRSHLRLRRGAPPLIPDKGRVLTGLSVHWFHQLGHPEPPALHRPRRGRRASRAHRRGVGGAAGTLDGRPPCRGHPDGVRGPRLPVRVVLGRVRRRGRPHHRAPARRAGHGRAVSTSPSSLRPPRPRTGHDENLTEAGPGRWSATTGTRS